MSIGQSRKIKSEMMQIIADALSPNYEVEHYSQTFNELDVRVRTPGGFERFTVSVKGPRWA